MTTTPIPNSKRDPKTYPIIGAAMAVHTELGSGFLEKVYQEALAIEFSRRGIPFKKEYEIPIRYGGVYLKTHYRADFVCFDSVLVELKALSKIGKPEISQVLNYLKATSYNPGILINFGASSLEHRTIKNKFLNSNNSTNPR